MTIKACFKSMRLRTLPLSLAGINMGVFIAAGVAEVSVLTVIFIVLTSSLLQILSNLSNELGDTLQGTDTVERQGIHYSIMDGQMTIPEMKRLVTIITALCALSGLCMIYFSFGTLFSLQAALFLLLGASAIIAAMRYTLGKNPYGYRGLGDIFVFLFFGLATTMGAAYLCAHEIVALMRAVLPACAVGCFSVGVLNVNNIRDMKTDERTRTTVAIRLGEKRSRIYQTVLIASGWALMVLNTFMVHGGAVKWTFAAVAPLFVLHLRGVWTRKGRDLDPMLPLLVMSTFLLTMVYGIVLCSGADYLEIG